MTEAIDTTNSSTKPRPSVEPDLDTAVTKMLQRAEPAGPVDRRALVAYASWLYFERSFICNELYPYLGWRANTFVVGDNSGFNYHHKNTPPASARSLQVLDLVGCDWKRDGYLGIGDEDGPHPDAVDFPHPDARLLDLEREYLVVRAEYDALRASEKEANAEFERREAAFIEAETKLLMCPPRRIPGGSGRLIRTYWQGEHVRRIIAGTFRGATSFDAECIAKTPRADLERLLPRIEAREERIRALREDLGLKALETQMTEKGAVVADAAERIYRLPAHTFDGLALKARVLRIEEPDLWKRPGTFDRYPAEWHELALTEIADGVDCLLTHGAANAMTRARVDPDLITEEGGFVVDCYAMAGAVANDDGTMNFCDAAGRVLHKSVADWVSFQAQRLFAQARTEMARQLGAPGLADADREKLDLKLRRELRVDALHILAFRAGAAFDAALQAEDDLPEVPAWKNPGAGKVSPDLLRAMEAHREARQIMIHDPVESDERTEAHVARLDALGDALRALPARSLADLRYKLIYLWPGSLEEEIGDSELAAIFSSMRDDVLRLAEESQQAPDIDAAAVGGGAE